MKKVIIRSQGEADPVTGEAGFNLAIFTTLIRELRIKLDITKEGLGPDKVNRAINFGLQPDALCNEETVIVNKLKRAKKIEQIILKDFNTINITRVQNALKEVN